MAEGTVLGRELGRRLLAQLAREEMLAQAGVRGWIEANLALRDKQRRVVPFRFNPVQARFEGERTGRDLILKARQMGFTTLVCGLFFADTVLHENTTSVMVAHDADSSERIFRIVQLFWERLPEEEKDRIGKPRFSNRREFLWPQINSHFFVGTAGATTFGRGQTINNLHCSEFAFWPNPTEALTALTEAVTPEGCIVIESTANGMGNAFHQLWSAASDGRVAYRRHFYPWWHDEEYRREGAPLGELTEGERALKKTHKLDARQLRWRRAKLADLGRSFAQEYPEDELSCFLQSGRAYFNVPRAYELSKKREKKPARVEDGGRLLIWAEPEEGRSYCLAADTAKGKQQERAAGDPSQERGGPDYSVAVVLDWLSGEQVAEWHGRVREIPFAHVLYGLWQRYPGLIVPERNGPGEIVAQRLHELEPKCVFCDGDGLPGWINTAQTRLAALGLLAQGIERDEVGMCSEGFWREVQTFITNERTGKPEAAVGFHDDRVLAVAIALHVRQSLPPPATGDTRLPPLDDYAADWDAKAPRSTIPFTRRRKR